MPLQEWLPVDHPSNSAGPSTEVTSNWGRQGTQAVFFRRMLHKYLNGAAKVRTLKYLGSRGSGELGTTWGHPTKKASDWKI